MISSQKTSSCLLENNTKVLGNDEADVNNQMSRKYKEENIGSYLKRFSSLVVLMPTLRAGFSLWVYKEQIWVQLLFLWFWVFLEIAELMWYQASMKEGSEFTKTNVQQIHNIGKCSKQKETSCPIKKNNQQTREKIVMMTMIGMKMIWNQRSSKLDGRSQCVNNW